MGDSPESQKNQTLSVSKRVLEKFVAAVGEEPDLKDVAARLKKTLVDDDNSSEAALRQALFGDEL